VPTCVAAPGVHANQSLTALRADIAIAPDAGQRSRAVDLQGGLRAHPWTA
jgi:hypothetical protein